MTIYFKALFLGLVVTAGHVHSMKGDLKLIDAIRDNKTTQASELIKQGVVLNVRDRYGCTPLIWACDLGKSELVDLLIKKKAELNIQSKISGNTALMKAVVKGHKEIVQKLIEENADLTKKDNLGRTAYVLAKEFDREEIEQLLLNAGSLSDELADFHGTFATEAELQLHKNSVNVRKKFI